MQAQTRFGFTAGFGTTGTYFGKLPDDADRKLKPAYRAGVMADIHLAGKFYLQPQLLVSTKGTAIDYDYPLLHIKYRSRLAYLELPVNVVYKHPLGKGKLIAGAGGFIGRGIKGKFNSEFTEKNTGKVTPYEFDIKFKRRIEPKDFQSDGQGSFANSIDAGLNVMAGYELKNGLAFNLLYSPGLANINPKEITPPAGEAYSPDKLRSSYIGISVSYLLPKLISKS